MRPTDWKQVFTDKVAAGKVSKADELIEKFHQLDSNIKTRGEADGLITSFIVFGCSVTCLIVVLKIGTKRYKRIKLDQPKKQAGGKKWVSDFY